MDARWIGRRAQRKHGIWDLEPRRLRAVTGSTLEFLHFARRKTTLAVSEGIINQ